MKVTDTLAAIGVVTVVFITVKMTMSVYKLFGPMPKKQKGGAA